MSTNSIRTRQDSNNSKADYGHFGPFASRTKGIFICSDALDEVLSFFAPKDLARSERVCKNWKRFTSNQWKRQCQIQLGIAPKIDLKKYLPKCPSYKESLRLMSYSILDGDVYRRYVGDVGPVPRIPEAISFKKWNEPDCFDPTKTVGTQYIWMYCPPYIETDLEGFSLDKPDNPNNLEAPNLIRKEVGLVEKLARKIGLRKKNVLQVPVTINNIENLFKLPKTGRSSKYDYIWNKITEQHGDKRIPAGWICIRRNVIGNNLTFAQQQALANEKGVIIPQLIHRILFNFLESARSRTYPDGRDPMWTIARTSTFTRDSENNSRSSYCGAGSVSGLDVGGGPFGLDLDGNLINHGCVGVVVAFPTGS